MIRHDNTGGKPATMRCLLFWIAYAYLYFFTTPASAFAFPTKPDSDPSGTYPDLLTPSSVVLVTGASGFIGSALVLSLVHTYNVSKVICIDPLVNNASPAVHPSSTLDHTEVEWRERLASDPRLKERSEEALAIFELKRQRIFHILRTLGSRVHWYRSDFRPTIPDYFDVGEVPLLDILFDRHEDITHIVHLADMYHAAMPERDLQVVPRSKNDTKAGMMEIFLEQLLKVKEERGHNAVPHFIYASSHEVYDPHKRHGNGGEEGTFTESGTISVPVSRRGASKLLDEVIAKNYHTYHKIFSIGLRFCNVYGPWGLPGTPLWEMAERAVSDPSLPILLYPDEALGLDVEDVRDYVYVDDAIDAVLSAMQFRPPVPPGDEEAPNLVINVGSGIGSTLDEIAMLMEQYFPRNKGARIEEDELLKKWHNDEPPTKIVASTERARVLLGFQARISLSKGIVKLLSWHYDRAHPYGERATMSDGVDHQRGAAEAVTKAGVESCITSDIECHRGATVFPCASDCAHWRQCTPSFLDDVTEMTRRLTDECTAVLYTVNFDEDLKSIPSANITVLPLSPSFFEQDLLSKTKRCNLAFVSESSPLLLGLKRDRGWLEYISVSEEYWRRVDDPQELLVDYIFTTGPWTIIPVMTSEKMDDEVYKFFTSGSEKHRAWNLNEHVNGIRTHDRHIVELLPKLAPGSFFGPSVKYAIYCDPDVLFAHVPGLLRMMEWHPRGQMERSTAMMVAGIGPQMCTNPYHCPNTHRSKRKEAETIQPTTSAMEGLQQRAYDSIRLGLRGHVTNGPFSDGSWIVHALESEDARLLRCDIYGEVIQWNVATEARALEFVAGLHDLWSRVIVQWNDKQAWGALNVDEKMQEEVKFWEGIDIFAGKWMGILSSTVRQSFLRVVPSSAVMATFVDV